MKKFSKKLTVLLMSLFITSQILAQKENPIVRTPWIDIVGVETFCDSITGKKIIRIEAKRNSGQICYFDILDLAGTPICTTILPVNIIPQTSASNGFYEIPQSCIVNGGNYKIIGRCGQPTGQLTAILTFTANFENCNVYGCCPGKNLVENGDFEGGNVKFINQYAYNPSTSAGATLPGQYSIVNQSQAASISPTWLVQDHGTCTGTGNFLAINGKTGQVPGGWVTIWEQTINVVPDSVYRFCAYMKNLPQCGFDVKPVILVDVNYFLTYPPTPISTITGPPGVCDWQLVSFIYTPTTNFATITIKLLDTNTGDGNDLAIDDVSLTMIPPLAPKYRQFTVATSNISSTGYNLTATPTNPLPTGCGYYWEVCQVNSIGSCIGAKVSNDPRWWTGATNFPGYTGTTPVLTGSGSTPPGVFKIGIDYKIRYGVWCECNSWSESSYIIKYSRKRGRKRFKITEVLSYPVEPSRLPIDFDRITN